MEGEGSRFEDVELEIQLAIVGCRSERSSGRERFERSRGGGKIIQIIDTICSHKNNRREGGRGKRRIIGITVDAITLVWSVILIFVVAILIAAIRTGIVIVAATTITVCSIPLL